MKHNKAAAIVLAMTMGASLLAGCGSSSDSSTASTGSEGATASGTSSGESSGTPDTSEAVELTMYLYGSEQVANQDVLDELNKKLTEKCNTTLSIKYISWGDVSTKYPLLWAANEPFDMAYASSSAPVPYATLARQGAAADITDLLDTCAPTLKSAISDDEWQSVTVDDRIYAVPCSYTEFTAYGFVYRKDLAEKYGIDTIESVEDCEAYMDAALADGWIPLNGNSDLSLDLYRMFLGTTSDWIDAPGLPSTDLYFAGSLSDPSTIFDPVQTDEFKAWAERMQEWSDKGYWPSDVLSGAQSAKDNFYNGLSAAYITHQPDWTGSYGTLQTKLPGVETEFYCFPESQNKILSKEGVENCTVISANSEHADRCLMVLEALMTDEECYDLFQYGIEGRQYEIVDGKVTVPDTYDEAKDAYGVSGWAMRMDEYNIPYATEDPRRYTLNDEWKQVAVKNPYIGFNFDSEEVTSELSAIANVDSQLGIQIMLGKTGMDPDEAVSQYCDKMSAAGLDTVLEAVNSQYAEFTGTAQ